MIFNPIFVGNNNKVVFSYTGNYTNTEYVSSEGTKYSLYTLTSSGILSVKMKNADIWVCGGGSSGTNDNTSSVMNKDAGGAGAYCESAMQQTLNGNYTVSIGAGNGGTTSVGELISAAGVASSNTGGTGGGNGGKGDGKSKYPFGDSTQFNCHCAGGGGGAYATSYTYWTTYNGGAGGSNGGDGSGLLFNSSETFIGTASEGKGGNFGGGDGGKVNGQTIYSGKAATFYGSGGGNGSKSSYNFTNHYGANGAGYQGVVYIRVPA